MEVYKEIYMEVYREVCRVLGDLQGVGRFAGICREQDIAG